MLPMRFKRIRTERGSIELQPGTSWGQTRRVPPDKREHRFPPAGDSAACLQPLWRESMLHQSSRCAPAHAPAQSTCFIGEFNKHQRAGLLNSANGRGGGTPLDWARAYSARLSGALRTKGPRQGTRLAPPRRASAARPPLPSPDARRVSLARAGIRVGLARAGVRVGLANPKPFRLASPAAPRSAAHREADGRAQTGPEA
jgi:hypothetical protein